MVSYPTECCSCCSCCNFCFPLLARFKPAKEQHFILKIMAIEALVIVLIESFGQYLKLFKAILYPFRMAMVIFHELGHASTAILCGGKLSGFKIRMNESGVTSYLSSGSGLCLISPAGFGGAAIISGILLFCGFGHKTSRFACIFLACTGIVIFWSGSLATAFVLLVYMAANILLAYFDPIVKNIIVVQHFVLLLGNVAFWSSISNIFQTVIIHKAEDSDGVVFATECMKFLPSRVVGVLFVMMSFFFVGSILLLSIAYYRKRSGDIEMSWK